MSHIPSEAEKIVVDGATVDFYKLAKDGQSTYYFDTSKEGPPQPMVNAMAGLKLVTNPHTKLIMINHKKPMGLLNKIEENFNIEFENLSDGKVKLTFSYKDGKSEKANLNDNSCHG